MALMASAGVPVGYGGYGGAYGGYGAGYGYGAGIGLAKVAAAPIVAKVAAPVYAPQPYDFGYQIHNQDGSTSNRQEVSDEHNNKKGSYGYTSPDGIYRQVDYVADAAGFRATIKTNEPGTAPQPAAATQIYAEEPPYKVLPAAAPIVKAVAATPVIAKAAYPAYGLGLRAGPVAYGGLGLRSGHLGYGASVAAPVYASGKYGYY